MRAFIRIAAIGIAAAAIGVWLHSTRNTVTEMSVLSKPVPAGISIWEIHNQAHLEFLPVQQVDDQSVIFTAARR
jgi:hypothetical protein